MADKKLIPLIFDDNGDVKLINGKVISAVPVSYPVIICTGIINNYLSDEALIKYSPKEANAYMGSSRREMQKKKHLDIGYESCSTWAVQYYKIKEKEN